MASTDQAGATTADAPGAPDIRPFSARRTVRLVRRQWPIVVAAGVIGLFVGIGWSWVQSPVYESTTVVALTPVVGLDAAAGATIAPAAVASQLELLRSESMRADVVARIGEPVDSTADAASPDTANIRITGIADTAERAALIANTYAETFAEQRTARDLELNAAAADAVRDRLDEVTALLSGDDSVLDVPYDPGDGRGIVTVTRGELESLQRDYRAQLLALSDQALFIAQGRIDVVDPALPPDSASSTAAGTVIMLGLLAGLVLGTVFVTLRDRYDTTLHSETDVTDHWPDLEMLGWLPNQTDEFGLQRDPVTLTDPASPGAEAYKTLRTSLSWLFAGPDHQVVQVTSANPAEGKTTVSTNLAVAIAQLGHRVLLIDLDLRRPAVHQRLGLANTQGFTTVVWGEATVDDVVNRGVGVATLDVLTSGPRPGDPSELLAGDDTASVLADLRARYPVVVVDTAPLLGVSDPLVVATLVDHTIVVARAGSTQRGELDAALSLLDGVQRPPLGYVLNKPGLIAEPVA